MPTMTIQSELYRRVKQTATAQAMTPEALLEEALQQYFWDMDRQKIKLEARTYRQHHAAIKEKFLGQYVALHQGQVVDHDEEFMALYGRVRQTFGPVAVMITQVEETADPVLVRRGFRLEPNHP